MTASFMHRIVIEHIRNLIEDVPAPARGPLCRELASAIMALAGEQYAASLRVDAPDDTRNGNGE